MTKFPFFCPLFRDNGSNNRMNQKKRSNSNSVIEGLVIPNQLDHDGKVIDITIQTNNKKTIFIAPNEAKRKLLTLVNKEVEAKGKMIERLNGTALLTLKSFRAIGDDAR
jgi:hypothetical protein